MSEMIKLPVALFMVCIVSGIVIVFTHLSTAEQIEAQKLHEQRTALEQMFPPGTRILDTTGTAPFPSRYWIGRNDTSIAGFAFPVESLGYSGLIRYIVAIDPQGRIMGMKILSQSETPGLGARMEEPVSGKSLWNFYKPLHNDPRPWFTEQFKGTSVSKPFSIFTTAEWHILTDAEKKERAENNTISAITGATVTAKAVVAGLEKTPSACYAAIQGAHK